MKRYRLLVLLTLLVTSLLLFSACGSDGNTVDLSQKAGDKIAEATATSSGTPETSEPSETAVKSDGTINSSGTTNSSGAVEEPVILEEEIIIEEEVIPAPTPETTTAPAPTTTATSETKPTPEQVEQANVHTSSSPGVKDRYQTDPVPEGMPQPVDNATVDNSQSYSCTLSITCHTIFDNVARLDQAKVSSVPESGVIFPAKTVQFSAGESVFDVLARECMNNSIQIDYTDNPVYNSPYIEGIHNLYEFDCGELSGWMYSVNGWFPNYGCGRYELQDGDVIRWEFTCNLGDDLGVTWMD